MSSVNNNVSKDAPTFENVTPLDRLTAMKEKRHITQILVNDIAHYDSRGNYWTLTLKVVSHILYVAGFVAMVAGSVLPLFSISFSGMPFAIAGGCIVLGILESYFSNKVTQREKTIESKQVLKGMFDQNASSAFNTNAYKGIDRRLHSDRLMKETFEERHQKEETKEETVENKNLWKIVPDPWGNYKPPHEASRVMRKYDLEMTIPAQVMIAAENAQSEDVTLKTGWDGVRQKTLNAKSILGGTPESGLEAAQRTWNGRGDEPQTYMRYMRALEEVQQEALQLSTQLFHRATSSLPRKNMSVSLEEQAKMDVEHLKQKFTRLKYLVTDELKKVQESFSSLSPLHFEPEPSVMKDMRRIERTLSQLEQLIGLLHGKLNEKEHLASAFQTKYQSFLLASHLYRLRDFIQRGESSAIEEFRKEFVREIPKDHPLYGLFESPLPEGEDLNIWRRKVTIYTHQYSFLPIEALKGLLKRVKEEKTILQIKQFLKEIDGKDAVTIEQKWAVLVRKLPNDHQLHAVLSPLPKTFTFEFKMWKSYVGKQVALCEASLEEKLKEDQLSSIQASNEALIQFFPQEHVLHAFFKQPIPGPLDEALSSWCETIQEYIDRHEIEERFLRALVADFELDTSSAEKINYRMKAFFTFEIDHLVSEIEPLKKEFTRMESAYYQKRIDRVEKELESAKRGKHFEEHQKLYEATCLELEKLKTKIDAIIKRNDERQIYDFDNALYELFLFKKNKVTPLLDKVFHHTFKEHCSFFGDALCSSTPVTPFQVSTSPLELSTYQFNAKKLQIHDQLKKIDSETVVSVYFQHLVLRWLPITIFVTVQSIFSNPWVIAGSMVGIISLSSLEKLMEKRFEVLENRKASLKIQEDLLIKEPSLKTLPTHRATADKIQVLRLGNEKGFVVPVERTLATESRLLVQKERPLGNEKKFVVPLEGTLATESRLLVQEERPSLYTRFRKFFNSKYLPPLPSAITNKIPPKDPKLAEVEKMQKMLGEELKFPTKAFKQKVNALKNALQDIKKSEQASLQKTLANSLRKEKKAIEKFITSNTTKKKAIETQLEKVKKEIEEIRKPPAASKASPNEVKLTKLKEEEASLVKKQVAIEEILKEANARKEELGKELEEKPLQQRVTKLLEKQKEMKGLSTSFSPDFRENHKKYEALLEDRSRLESDQNKLLDKEEGIKTELSRLIQKETRTITEQEKLQQFVDKVEEGKTKQALIARQQTCKKELEELQAEKKVIDKQLQSVRDNKANLALKLEALEKRISVKSSEMQAQSDLRILKKTSLSLEKKMREAFDRDDKEEVAKLTKKWTTISKRISAKEAEVPIWVEYSELYDGKDKFSKEKVGELEGRLKAHLDLSTFLKQKQELKMAFQEVSRLEEFPKIETEMKKVKNLKEAVVRRERRLIELVGKINEHNESLKKTTKDSPKISKLQKELDEFKKQAKQKEIEWVILKYRFVKEGIPMLLDQLSPNINPPKILHHREYDALIKQKRELEKLQDQAIEPLAKLNREKKILDRKFEALGLVCNKNKWDISNLEADSKKKDEKFPKEKQELIEVHKKIKEVESKIDDAKTRARDLGLQIIPINDKIKKISSGG